MEKSKDFLVSTADVAFIVNGTLAFTGTTSLNTSISVSMEDQEITGGKGNKTLYKYKYGRKLAPSIEMAEWNLRDVFAVSECVTLTNGTGTLQKVPVGKVYVEKADGSSVEVTPVGSTITIGSSNETVSVTYQYNTTVKRVTIDAESAPLVGKLILTADKHNNKTGKVGEVQIEVPSFQLSGTFDISLEASGSTTTKLDGDALAVNCASCSDGSVYAYITDIPSAASAVTISDIAVTPAVIELAANETMTLSVIGIKGGLYSNVSIDISECNITSEDTAVATVVNGIVTGVAAGVTYINIEYNGIKDFVKVTVA